MLSARQTTNYLWKYCFKICNEPQYMSPKNSYILKIMQISV